MQDVPTDIVHYMSTYLTDSELMKFSTTTKKDWNLPRDKTYKKCIHKKLMPLILLGENNVFWCEDKDEIAEFKETMNIDNLLPNDTKQMIIDDYSYLLYIFADSL